MHRDHRNQLALAEGVKVWSLSLEAHSQTAKMIKETSRGNGKRYYPNNNFKHSTEETSPTICPFFLPFYFPPIPQQKDITKRETEVTEDRTAKHKQMPNSDTTAVCKGKSTDLFTKIRKICFITLM